MLNAKAKALHAKEREPYNPAISITFGLKKLEQHRQAILINIKQGKQTF